MSLSDLQQRVALLVFSLAEADGFALAGGGALIAHDVVDRTTRDLDCFGPSRDAVDRLWPAIRDRLLSAGLEVDVRQSDHGFAKMSVTDLTTGETTQVDVGFDPAAHASIAMSIGPVRALDDLAGDKLLALFGKGRPEGLRRCTRAACTLHPPHTRVARGRQGSRLQPCRVARRVRRARRSASFSIRGG
jgi:hypothetical protein